MSRQGCPRRAFAAVEPECYSADRKSMAQPGIGPRIMHKDAAFGPASAVHPVPFFSRRSMPKSPRTRQ